MSRASAERRAYLALAECNLSRPPFNPKVVANYFGAEVVETAADQAESGFCLRDGSRVVIGVNTFHSSHRQRFTIAHEVGHLLLHSGRALTVDKVVRISYRDEVSSMATDFEEIEANTFGAALLMPAVLVRDEAEKLVNQGFGEAALKSSLARTFDVSEQAMTYRLVNLGIFFG